MYRRVLAIALAAASLVLAPATVARAATTACSIESSFDSGGDADVAIGVPGETLAGDRDAGAVTVLYGESGGFGGRDDFWHQDSSGIRGVAEPGDGFGAAVAKGNFDGDAYADLAIGVPGEDSGAGMVHVLYGGMDGLVAAGSQRIMQSLADIPGSAEAGDAFGYALAAGDFDEDGRDDLAIGAPGEGLQGAEQGGVVTVISGSASGLDRSTARAITQGANGIPGAPEDYDRFGLALAACDFDNDGDFDLAIGSDESTADALFAGKVNVLEGPALNGPGQVLMQAAAESGDGFGSALAVGDFDGNEAGDLAVGAPGEGLGSNSDQGVVQVFTGAADADLTAGSVFEQGSEDLLGEAGAYEFFGFALAAGDFDNSGEDDLAIGIPGDRSGEGAVALLLGSPSGGLTEAGDALYAQDDAGVPGTGERGDHWGSALAMVQNDGNVAATLIAGAAEENIRTVDDGAVTVLYGAGFAADMIHQDSAGIQSAAERADLFGYAAG